MSRVRVPATHPVLELRVAGNKAGRWHTWYDRAISLADLRFAEHLATSGKE
jgi:hypothetical protein